MIPLLGAGHALSWSRRHPPEPQPGDLDRTEAEPQVDVIVFGDFDPRRDKPC